MPRNTRSLRIPRFNQFENYMYNSNGKRVLRMQPPPELQIVDQQKWLKKQARYRRPTNNGMAMDYATNCWPADEGPSAVNILQTKSETSQRAKDLQEKLPLNLRKYADNVIQDSSLFVIHGAKECNISERNMNALHDARQCNISERNIDAVHSHTKGKSAIQGHANRQNHQLYIINSVEKHASTKKTTTRATYTHRKKQLQSENPPDHTTCTKGVSPLYIDIGDSDYVCQYCNAMFWYSERLKGNSHQHYPKYTKCCGAGQVYLKKEVDPPEYFKQLFKNKHFLDNIRAYNQMFSMTSFGAKIDESINNGKGPYVFKISGQIHHWIGTLCPTSGKDPRFLQLYIYDTENEVHNRMEPFGGTERSGLKTEIVESLIQVLNEHNELVKLFRTARDRLNEGNVPEFKIQLYNVVGAQNINYLLPEFLEQLSFSLMQTVKQIMTLS